MTVGKSNSLCMHLMVSITLLVEGASPKNVELHLDRSFQRKTISVDLNKAMCVQDVRLPPNNGGGIKLIIGVLNLLQCQPPFS